MEALVITMVLLAAALHAGWNLMVKIRGERMLVMAMITGWSGTCSAVLLPFVQVPTADVWPYIAASLVLHNLYYLFLISAYRHGDLSHVYPIARGSAPLFVAILSVFVLGEEIDQRGMIAIGLIAGGLMSLALTRGVGGLRDIRAILYALGTGAFVALYTIVDGTGARLASSPHAYTFWLFALDGIPLALFAVVVKRRQIGPFLRENWHAGLIAGSVSMASAWLFIWALTLAPIPYVAALREMGMVFAVILGVVVLKERLDLVKLAAVASTLAGTVMLRINR